MQNYLTATPVGLTDPGCERDLNEDRYDVIQGSSGTCWIVCDGMGGANGGDLAAQMTVDSLRRNFTTLPKRPVEFALEQAVSEANRLISLKRQTPTFASMGTTIVAALQSEQEVAIASLGDSRVYLVRGASIEQLTKDHTYVQSLVDRGEISAEEAMSHPKAHVLTKAVGSETIADANIQKYWLWDEEDEGSILVLCSDGLYSHVSDNEIARAVTSSEPLEACQELIELAKARGGYDNITVSVIPFSGVLKKERPTGYQEMGLDSLSPYQTASVGRAKKTSSLNFWRTVTVAIVLSLLSSLLVAFGMIIKLSR